MNSKLSTEIFNLLMNGKVINKNVLDINNDQKMPNKYFTEISSNIDGYKEHYFNSGFELVDKISNCFFIRSLGEDKGNVKIASKIQALLIVLGRGITQDNFELDVMFDSHAGLTKEMVNKINKNEDYRTVLDATRIESDLWDECKKLLVDRQIALVNRSGNYVVLDAGRSMYEVLIKQGAEEIF